MKILVTGGAGFIGAHVVKKLLKENNEVYVVDDLSSGQVKNIPSKAFFINQDITNEEEMEKVFKLNFAAVVHLAAIISPSEIRKNPARHIAVNIKAPLNLMTLSKRYGVKKFINTSSMAVYGNAPNSLVSEETPAAPVSLYGLGKLITEYNSLLVKGRKLTIVNARFFNVYGPGQDIEDTRSGMFRIFLNYVYHHKPILIKGPLDRFRDFIYVEDVVNALVSLLNKQKLEHKVYNVCSGRKTTIKELLDLIITNFGKEPEKYPIKVERRLHGDIYAVYGDNSRLTTEVKWQPETDLPVGVKKTVRSYLR